MLDPNTPNLYVDALTPPEGFHLDLAVATTFSFDPAFLLDALVHLASLSPGDGLEADPIFVLEGVRTLSDKIIVYAQRGRALVPDFLKSTPLMSLTDRMLINVKSPNGGVFHPKIWALRFIGETEERELRHRLLILSRNMTYDRSWDLSLRLEGSLTRKIIKENRPLRLLFSLLPEFATESLDKKIIQSTMGLADELARVEWELPEGFDELRFYLPWVKKYEWIPPRSDRMAIVSPFCTNRALKELTKNTEIADAIISLPNTLSTLKKEVLGLFEKSYYLNEAAETEDGEESVELPGGEVEGEAEGAAEGEENADWNNHGIGYGAGLHAKAYLFECGGKPKETHLVMGSANATDAAFLEGKNIEILAELIGKTSKVGGIWDFLGPDEAGPYLLEFEDTEPPEEDKEEAAEKEALEKARDLLSEADLSVHCLKGSSEGLWELVLEGNLPRLSSVSSLSVRPITVNKSFAVHLKLTGGFFQKSLGEFQTASVTGFLAFELKSLSGKAHPLCFGLNLPTQGIPEDRKSAVFKTVIDNGDKFFNHLFLILGSEGILSRIAARSRKGRHGKTVLMSEIGDIPILETMTRALYHNPGKLSEIAAFIGDLSEGSDSSFIPEDYLQLIKIFKKASGK
jgi:hypothetical protein